MVNKDASSSGFTSDPLKPEGEVTLTGSQEVHASTSPTTDPLSPAGLGDPASGGTYPSSTTSNANTGEAKSKAEDLSHEAKLKAEQLRTEAKAKVAEAQQEGRRLMDEVRNRGVAEAENSKRLVADQISGIANALGAAVHQLEEQNQPRTAQYMTQAASGIERIAQSVRDQDFRGLVHQAEDLARRQPGLFLGGAVAGGFLLARFLKSSANRHPDTYASSSHRDSSSWHQPSAYQPPTGYRDRAVGNPEHDLSTDPLVAEAASANKTPPGSTGRSVGNPDFDLKTRSSTVGATHVHTP